MRWEGLAVDCTDLSFRRGHRQAGRAEIRSQLGCCCCSTLCGGLPLQHGLLAGGHCWP